MLLLKEGSCSLPMSHRHKTLTACFVIMQSSALKQKAWQDTVQGCTPSTPILPPGEAVMSEDSHIAWPAHTWLHTVRHLFLPSLSLHHEYGYFSHKWGGFVFCTHPQAGLAMTCLQRGSARFFTRWFLCCFIYLPARILFLPSAVMTITNHRVETFPPSLHFQSYIISNDLIFSFMVARVWVMSDMWITHILLARAMMCVERWKVYWWGDQ